MEKGSPYFMSPPRPIRPPKPPHKYFEKLYIPGKCEIYYNSKSLVKDSNYIFHNHNIPNDHHRKRNDIFGYAPNQIIPLRLHAACVLKFSDIDKLYEKNNNPQKAIMIGIFQELELPLNRFKSRFKSYMQYSLYYRLIYHSYNVSTFFDFYECIYGKNIKYILLGNQIIYPGRFSYEFKYLLPYEIVINIINLWPEFNRWNPIL